MAIIRIGSPDELFTLLENYSLTLNPRHTFVSSSADGVISGSMPLQARSKKRTLRIDLGQYYPEDHEYVVNSLSKVAQPLLDLFDETGWATLALLETAQQIGHISGSFPAQWHEESTLGTGELNSEAYNRLVNQYMQGVNKRPRPSSTSKEFNILRF